MNSTYAQKSESIQRMASHNAASIMGSAIQCQSLEDEEEPVQGKFIQRAAIPEEEELA